MFLFGNTAVMVYVCADHSDFSHALYVTMALTDIKQTSTFPRPILFFQVNYGFSMYICRREPPTQILDIQKSCSYGCLAKAVIYVHCTTACLLTVNSVLFRNKQNCAVFILWVLSDTSWKKKIFFSCPSPFKSW